MNDASLEQKIQTLPKNPGVYRFFDSKGKIIYIGKAKNLKKRVSSYFQKQHENGKVRVLVSKIKDLNYIVVETEQDALLLENNLIKKHQPKYNVMLKDDKTYPWICIKKERFPRVFSTRTLVKDGSEYFGPYTNGKMMNTLLDFVTKLYPLRTCNYHLSEENIEQKKYKVCLQYHIKKCLGPCEGLQTEEDYNAQIAHIKNILKGNITEIITELKRMMKTYSENYEYENAQLTKEKLDLLEKFQARSTVVNPKINNVDVFTIVKENDFACVNFIKVVNGAIIQGHTLELKSKLDEPEEELLSIGITDLRERFNSNSKEIYCNITPSVEPEGVSIHLPQIGDKKRLIDLSLRNAKYYLLDKKLKKQTIKEKKQKNPVLEELQKNLHLSTLPTHIECFDNSNIQGTNPVAACVVFKNGKPANKDYRHFNIKTVEGPDDFASMEEVVYRRYKRLSEEKQPLPQLILIDGGKGQLSSAVKSLKKLDLYGKIAIIGIAKKLEEIYFPEDSIPIYLDKRSQGLKLIQHMRNEAHRFGITHHRNKRSKNSFKTELESIKGVGKTTIETLLKKYGSVERIKKTSEKEIEETIGKSKAKLVLSYFKS